MSEGVLSGILFFGTPRTRSCCVGRGCLSRVFACTRASASRRFRSVTVLNPRTGLPGGVLGVGGSVASIVHHMCGPADPSTVYKIVSCT